MVGSPYQTDETLTEDLFSAKLRPQMTGITLFRTATPVRSLRVQETGTNTLSFISYRLLLPYVLLPATTALGTIDSNGREKGLQHGLM